MSGDSIDVDLGAVGDLSFHHLDEAGVVVAAIEQGCGVGRLAEARLALEVLGRLLPP